MIKWIQNHVRNIRKDLGISASSWRYLFSNRVDFFFRLIAFDEDEGETENADIKNDSLSNLYDITSESKL